MRVLLSGLLSPSNSFFYFIKNREAREAKRGGTAPGEQRVKQNATGNNANPSSTAYDLIKMYGVNPRIQKINIASPNVKNGQNSTI